MARDARESLTDAFEDRFEPRSSPRSSATGGYAEVVRLAIEDEAALRHDPRLRASLHVALNVSAIGPEEAVLVASSLSDWSAALRESSGLMKRARVLDLCRAFALAVCGLDSASIDLEMFDRVAHVLSVLSRDRARTVATSAAAALGALAMVDPGGGLARSTTRVGEATPQQPGSAERRSAVARAIDWLLGRSGGGDLRTALGPLDGYATAEVIRALAEWRSVAPATADAAAQELGKANDSAVIHALGELALAAPPEERARRLMALAGRAESLETPDPVIELWRGRRSEPARDMLLAWAALRDAARESIAEARPVALELLVAIEETIARIEERVRGPVVDADESALDIALFGSPLLHDVLIAQAKTLADARLARQRWEGVVLAARSGRAERLRKSVRGAHERREAVRRLVLAVDATPAGAEPEPAAPASAKSILTRVRALIASNHDAMMDRPLARAFAVCIERAVPEAASVETLGLILAFRNEAFRKYSAEFAGGKLVLAAKALLQVRASVDRTLKALGTAEDRHPRPGARGKRRLARELLPSLRDLSKKVGLLGDGPIVRGLDDLVGVAVHLLHQRRPSAALAGVVADAIETLSTGMREAAAAVGAPSPRGPSVAALQRRVEELVARPTSRAGLEAKREIERVLPPILGGLLDVIFALQGALDTEAEPPPPVIGDYQVVKALGAGGMGSCLLVRSRSRDDDRTYVLKVPQRTSGHYRTWFRREALALLSLADAPHRGIVRFVSFHDGLGGRPHLVMEWVDGESLEAHIATQALPIGEAIGVVADLASAVAHAHARGIGHYDIKPANVVLHMASIPVLVDWGIAGATCQSRVGTPYYMAPERLRPDDNDWPLASDIFSLACVLCEIVGKTRLLEPTWSDADESVDKGFMERLASIDLPRGHDQLVLARLHENRKVLAERARRMLGPCPDRVVSLVLEMLDPNPARRPSAAYVERALRAYC
jgi:hypothetical protein